MPSSAHRRPHPPPTFPYPTLFRSVGPRRRPLLRAALAPVPLAQRGVRHVRRLPRALPALEPQAGPPRASLGRRVGPLGARGARRRADRKSTRLNSSHVEISYAVFCSPPPPPSSHLSLPDALPICGSSPTTASSGGSRSSSTGTTRGTPRSTTTSRASGTRAASRSAASVARSPSRASRCAWCEATSRSEEHTSELQSRRDLVCRLLLTAAPTLLPPFPTRRSSDLWVLADDRFFGRLSLQFHWHNEGYATFDDYLARFRHSSRKQVRRERRSVAESGLSVRVVRGDEQIGRAHV